VFPGSGIGGGDRAVVFAIMSLGLFLWEVFYHGNARKWPVWALLLPAFACFYLAAREDASDQSWYWITLILSLGIGYLVYFAFWADERQKGRR